MLEEKTIQFANFNITFGENEEAMLMHFEDIVFPAFTGGYIRGKENELPRYSFGDVTIKMIDNEHVLVGNYIKDKIKTDTGIEITIPSDFFDNSEYIEFINNPNGTISISIKNVGKIINR